MYNSRFASSSSSFSLLLTFWNWVQISYSNRDWQEERKIDYGQAYTCNQFRPNGVGVLIMIIIRHAKWFWLLFWVFFHWIMFIVNTVAGILHICKKKKKEKLHPFRCVSFFRWLLNRFSLPMYFAGPIENSITWNNLWNSDCCLSVSAYMPQRCQQKIAQTSNIRVTMCRVSTKDWIEF